MRLLLIILIAIVLLSSQPVVSATWLNSRQALIEWNATTPVCIWRKSLNGSFLIGCYKNQGKLILPPNPPADYAYFPREGDQYVLTDDQGNRVTAILNWKLYLARVNK